MSEVSCGNPENHRPSLKEALDLQGIDEKRLIDILITPGKAQALIAKIEQLSPSKTAFIAQETRGKVSKNVHNPFERREIENQKLLNLPQEVSDFHDDLEPHALAKLQQELSLQLKPLFAEARRRGIIDKLGSTINSDTFYKKRAYQGRGVKIYLTLTQHTLMEELSKTLML